MVFSQFTQRIQQFSLSSSCCMVYFYVCGICAGYFGSSKGLYVCLIRVFKLSVGVNVDEYLSSSTATQCRCSKTIPIGGSFDAISAITLHSLILLCLPTVKANLSMISAGRETNLHSWKHHKSVLSLPGLAMVCIHLLIECCCCCFLTNGQRFAVSSCQHCQRRK